MKEIVLVYPGQNRSKKKGFKRLINHFVPPVPFGHPVSLLPLAGVLNDNGYPVKILDARVEDFKIYDYSNTLCVGISTMTVGNMIRHGIKVSEHIHNNYPGVPVIWGGIHPSVEPDSTIHSKHADLVVRGEGERPLLEIVKRLADGQGLEGVPGVSYKENGKVIHNPDQTDYLDLDSLNIPPYHLLNLEGYPRTRESFIYSSSRGCPSACRFCYNLKYNCRRWRPRSVERVLEDLEVIVSRYNPTLLKFWDDNFFVSRKRVQGILEGIRERGWKFNWNANCRCDYFAKYNDDFIQLMIDTGCTMLGFGGESASPRILEYLHKHVTREQLSETVRKAGKFDLEVQFSWMAGFPGETKEDVYLTLDFMDEAQRINPKVRFNSFNMLVPLPGTPMTEEVERLGFRKPKTLEDWSKFTWNSRDHVVWHKKEYLDLLETLALMIRLRFMAANPLLRNLPRRIRIPVDIMCWLAERRWKERFFNFPYEWKAFDKVRSLFLDYF